MSPSQIANLPIKENFKKYENDIVRLVLEIISAYKDYQNFRDKKTSTWETLKEKIQRIDNEIDALVYEMYGVSEKEISIINDFINRLGS